MATRKHRFARPTPVKVGAVGMVQRRCDLCGEARVSDPEVLRRLPWLIAECRSRERAGAVEAAALAVEGFLVRLGLRAGFDCLAE